MPNQRVAQGSFRMFRIFFLSSRGVSINQTNLSRR